MFAELSVQPGDSAGTVQEITQQAFIPDVGAEQKIPVNSEQEVARLILKLRRRC